MKFLRFMLEILPPLKCQKDKNSSYTSGSTEARSEEPASQQKQGSQPEDSTPEFHSFLGSIPFSDLYHHFKDIWHEPSSPRRYDFPSKGLLTSGPSASYSPPNSSRDDIDPQKSNMSVDEAIDYAFGPLAAKYKENQQKNAPNVEAISPASITPVANYDNPEFASALAALLDENTDIGQAAIIANCGNVIAWQSTFNQARVDDVKFKEELTEIGLTLAELRKAMQRIPALGELSEAVIQSAGRTIMLFDAGANGVLATTARTTENLGLAMLDSREATKRIGKLSMI